MAAQEQSKHQDNENVIFRSLRIKVFQIQYFHVKPKRNPKPWSMCWSKLCSLKSWTALNPNGVYFHFRRKTVQIKQNERNYPFQANLQLQFPAVHAVSPSRPQQSALNQVLLQCYLQAGRLGGQEAFQREKLKTRMVIPGRCCRRAYGRNAVLWKRVES